MPRKTMQTSASKAAPLRIIFFTIPLWGSFVLLMLFMPMTGLIGAVLLGFCLLYLPFKARKGLCPKCQTLKTFPFSGFGSRCQGCGNELVLRGDTIHLIEPKSKVGRPGTGRSSR